MLRRLTIFAILILWLGTSPVCAQSTAPATAGKQGPKKKVSRKIAAKQAKPQPAEPIYVAPPPPPTPEQQPSVAPEVSYQGGLLTIKAPNSTMNDVLSAVRRVTGATIEKPPSGGSDRVVAQIGPGQPKDVLESLFNGSRYDYIILGSATRPGGVERVILTARANAGAPSAVAANRPNPAGQPPRPNVQPAQGDDQEEPEADTEDMTVPERDQAEQPEGQDQQPQTAPQGMPVQPPPEQVQPQGQAQDQNQQPRVKSPDELLRELQQMQKQPPDQNQPQQEPPPPQ